MYALCLRVTLTPWLTWGGGLNPTQTEMRFLKCVSALRPHGTGSVQWWKGGLVFEDDNDREDNYTKAGSRVTQNTTRALINIEATPTWFVIALCHALLHTIISCSHLFQYLPTRYRTDQGAAILDHGGSYVGLLPGQGENSALGS